MRKITGLIIATLAAPSIFLFWPAAIAQQAPPPPPAVTDLQLQVARAESAEKAAQFNKLAYERTVEDARKIQTQLTQDVAAKDAWWDKCIRAPSCVEWVNSAPAHETEKPATSVPAGKPTPLRPR
jgi:hypothetical protein